MPTIIEFKCNGDDGRSCDEDNPEKFLKGSTKKCKACHARYQRRWQYAKKLGVRVSEACIVGEGYGKVALKRRNSESSEAEEKPKGETKLTKLRAKLAKSRKEILELRGELDEANEKIAQLSGSMERILVISEDAIAGAKR